MQSLRSDRCILKQEWILLNYCFIQSDIHSFALHQCMYSLVFELITLALLFYLSYRNLIGCIMFKFAIKIAFQKNNKGVAWLNECLHIFSSLTRRSLEVAKLHWPHQYKPGILTWMRYVYNRHLPVANGRPFCVWQGRLTSANLRILLTFSLILSIWAGNTNKFNSACKTGFCNTQRIV